MSEPNDQVEQICTQVGMIMEDASGIALTMSKVRPEDRAEVLRKLAEIANVVAYLVAAAQVSLREGA